ncbi:hypothetical protein PanWU01x14_345060 [Parasponia andersonii]|uniref:Uncharacterized protein n=1 Tax=Parasponia andersonii TaxID=3476 RepID=A0A2P5ACW0_PARAD|nr:hypothetical protein PanWU01x14_345060 [Parasponia andersonii]
MAEITKIQAGQQSNVGGSNTTPSRPEVQREEVQLQEIHVNPMVAVGISSQLKKFRFVDSIPTSIRLLLNIIQGADESVVVHVPFDEEVFGEAFRLPVLKEDIIEFCKLQQIGAVDITLYMRHLHHLVTQYGYQDRYMFMDFSAAAT